MAIRLAHDPAWRAALSSRIAERKSRIYRDTSAVRALEDFLEQAARAPRV